MHYAELQARLQSSRFASSSSQAHAACAFRSRPRCPHSRRSSCKARYLVVTGAQKSFYDILGVDKKANIKTLKKAYKQKALKYHPDVNKEENAKELFMECKTAYQTLADAEQRRKYDRMLDGPGFDWGSFGEAFKGTSTSQPRPPPKRREEEEFYGFDAFFKDVGNSLSQGFAQLQNAFRDLDKDFQEQQASRTGQPRSLWQEVRDLGEEFVEFLEQEVASVEQRSRKSRSQAEQSAQDAGAEGQQAAQASKKSAEERAREAEEAAAAARGKAEQEIEDMLADLKRNLKS